MTRKAKDANGEETAKLLANRDEEGNIRLYEPGQEPTIWKKVESSITSKDSLDRPSSLDSQTGRGSSYTEQEKTYTTTFPRTTYTNKQSFTSDDDLVLPVSSVSEALPVTKDNLKTLVEYLVSITTTSIGKARAFYIWIPHNINYDTSGYFNRALLKPTDPASALANRLTVCEGYYRLFEAFCSEFDIPVKIIGGYAKAYGCQPGEDVTENSQNAHAWNAIYLDSDWFLVDVTWGAGFVKSKERKFVRNGSFSEGVLEKKNIDSGSECSEQSGGRIYVEMEPSGVHWAGMTDRYQGCLYH
ncbi:KY-like protein [Mya arenaria]|uniref:KY-like protein n=1 Tax=Mya arenaria TaxID=6604 RepID=A0ABY7G4M4_MYAAR|nr:KY-like protein [Mya arenaria]